MALAEIGYTGGRFATLFVVPQGDEALAALEARLDVATLERWVGAMAPTALSVTLPRFRVEPGAPVVLRQHLEALGMPTAFDPARADFSGIAAVPLHIDNVYHKAFVAVDEGGTEAAVVMNTGLSAEAGSSQAGKSRSFPLEIGVWTVQPDPDAVRPKASATICLAKGSGTPKDVVRAAKLFRAACDAGFAAANAAKTP